ncbi:MAG TPA: exosortase-associated EpsI family protein [Gemmataceae bacterium]
MSRVLPIVTVFAGVLVAGLVPGLWAGRWTASAAVDDAAARLAAVPATVGDWAGRDQEVNPREREVAQVAGFLSRRYVHARTGQAVSVVLLCGRPGPVSLHTPEVCYLGAGFEEIGTRSPVDVPGSPGDRLWTRRFRKTAAAPAYLRVLYGWSATGPWEAPDENPPRLTFARKPALYKLYVVRELARPDEPLDGDPALDFVRGLLPELRGVLFPPG